MHLFGCINLRIPAKQQEKSMRNATYIKSHLNDYDSKKLSVLEVKYRSDSLLTASVNDYACSVSHPRIILNAYL